MTRAPRGFTLIELLVTITILAIGMMVAVPSMITFQRNAEMRSAVSALTSAIQAARSEAMKRNLRAELVPASGTAWSNGYVVFVDTNLNGAYDAASGDILVMRQSALPSNLEIVATGTAAASPPYVRFDGSGYVRDNAGGFANLAITIRRRDTVGKNTEYAQTRRVMITQAGRVRTCTPASASDANCDPATP